MVIFAWGLYASFSYGELDYIAIPIVAVFLSLLSLASFYAFSHFQEQKLEKIYQFYFRVCYPEHLLLKNWEKSPKISSFELILIPIEAKKEFTIEK